MITDSGWVALVAVSKPVYWGRDWGLAPQREGIAEALAVGQVSLFHLRASRHVKGMASAPNPEIPTLAGINIQHSVSFAFISHKVLYTKIMCGYFIHLMLIAMPEKTTTSTLVSFKGPLCGEGYCLSTSP